jgi:hypothetical protein
MTDSLGEYTFLPWLRQGVARSIVTADSDQTVHLRATARVELNITGQAISGPALEQGIGRDVELYGPGEVIGIENRAIIRTDPRPWITNAEPGYLAQIEFYEEDFPWRYTPTAPYTNGLRLRPWIALVVLEDTGDPATAEFREAKAVADRPLSFISVKDFTGFPPADQLWAWAHVHINGRMTGGAAELVALDIPGAVQRVATALAGNPDLGYSRLVCPRRLKEDAAYHAFLVPTFERGRLAGLGMDPDEAPYASASAWADYGGRPEPLNIPFYYRWYFRTGGVGDFESLVRLLSWETVDPRVGHRDMDMQAPGSNIAGILDADLHGVLRLGGALRAPFDTLSQPGQAEFLTYENWARNPWPHPFQQRLAAFINLAETFTRTPAEQARTDAGLPPADPDDVDPLITSPIYGEWQAAQHRLLTDPSGADLVPNDNWIHELNLDPRHRVAAGFGGDVVRQHQEDYMEAAWKQVGDVLAHNQKVRVALTWLSVGDAIYAKSIGTLAHSSPSRLLAFTAPVQKRVTADGLTTHFARLKSMTPPVLTSPPMRRIARPAGPIARRLELAGGPHAMTFLESVNEEKISAAPPKEAPAGAASVESVAGAVAQHRPSPPQWLVALARRVPWLRLVFAILAGVLVVLAFVLPGLAILFAILAALVAGAAAGLEILSRFPTVTEALGAHLDETASIDQLGPGPTFVFGQQRTGGSVLSRLFAHDNAEATRFKAALREWAGFAQLAQRAGTVAPRARLDLTSVAGSVADALRPSNTIPKRLLSTATIAPHVQGQLVTLFDEIKYYPRIDEPMYRPLKDLGDERFVPNLNLIKMNTVVALETNQDFIEAYMVGVNSEFSRELLWREYPTDMRGSYFRQFWDVTPYLDPAASDEELLRESLYDIPQIHRWLHTSRLGEHDNRQPAPSVERNEIVLAIRGELLKKYPNTVIYAHAAQWTMTDGHVDPAKERELVPIAEGELEKPPRTKVRTPLYEAKVDPDIYFFGFDLDADEARGGVGEHDTDPPGWFFVLKERPGEPRFGLDTLRDAADPIVTVNDLAWSDTGVAPGGHLDAASLSPLALVAPNAGRDDLEKQPQHDDDVKVVPASVSAARWAYLLYQAPVMVAVHAAELLQQQSD